MKNIPVKDRVSKKEYLLATLWCVLSCSIDDEGIMEVMDAIENRPITKDLWQEFSSTGNTRKTALKELKKML